MKNACVNLLVPGLVMLASLVLFTGCEEESLTTSGDIVNTLDIRGGNEQTGNTNCVLVNPSEEINETEILMLQYMREEEKLARDVYVVLFETFGTPVFNRIARSEQKHMDQILCLLDHYDLEDPASPDPGVFSDETLQQLYNSLVAAGSVSEVAALRVGATIEDVDIFDLEENMGLTSNEAILTVFANLSCGSRNHLRAFVSLLEQNNETYEAQFITDDELLAILSSEKENCGNELGNGPGKGGNGGNGGSGGNGGGNGNCDGSGNEEGGGNGGNGGSGDNGGNGGNGGSGGNGGGNGGGGNGGGH